MTEFYPTDTALTSSRQAVSEGLASSHQLANIEWKNKPVVHEKPSRQANQNNFVLDQVNTGAWHKQELSPPHLQESVPMAGEENHKAASPAIGDTISTDNLPVKIENSTKLQDHSLAVSSKHNVTTSTVENDSIKKNLSDSDSHNEWFTNTSLVMRNSTILHDHQSTVKPYTAADYLKTLYPQLSVFKAPFEIDEKNPSSVKDFLKPSPHAMHSSSFLPRNGTLSKNTSSAPITLATSDDDPHSNKLSQEVQRKLQQALLMSLLKSPSNLGGRSAVKQSPSVPRYISSASNLLLSRSKKPGKHVPGYRYLTEAGAKLLPAHIFSPLGSEFKDPLEASPTPYTTSPSTPVQTTGPPQTKAKFHPIEPTQMGLIQQQTQSNAGKESSTAPAIVPTQSGMIPGLSPTITPLAPTQSGFIPTQSEPAKAILPTAKPFPAQLGFVSSNTEKQENVWRNAHDAEEDWETNKPKTPTIKHRLSSHEAQASNQEQASKQKPETSRLHENARLGDKNNRSKSRAYISRITDSSPAHSRQRRQMFLPMPLMQANDNLQQLGQSLLPLPGQLSGQQLLSDLPQLQQQQQPFQQFLPTQPLQSLVPQFVPATSQALDPLQLLGQSGKHDV